MSDQAPDFVIHKCAVQTAIWEYSRLYGEAISRVAVDLRDDTAWVDNGEYASRVVFCPYCGERLAPDPIIAEDVERERTGG